ncbi:dTDP-4-dehydrorhamnose reductase [Algibacter miyuki]|uniref:dTDP-4-dehydrorhamnose reductase n=1 Tax=Algibacter miyuki TaxID=1306933 RepID=A0ABV5GVE8_9FLAO|nr:dTDP-4-dehydrorhamnose reductase [Algibacter miyuki]MDN3664927.1 dTDP-4-dehydrorhamnose reductase [Algibacter miyuki]
MNTRVLVTGAGGQLGKTIAERFTENTNNLDFIFATSKDLDITKKQDVLDFFRKNNFDYCINCAAYTNVEQAEKTPMIAFEVNAEGVKNIAEACKETNSILIHVSTDYVFDGEKTTPYIVTDEPNPINEYGKSKLKGENYIKETLEKYFIVRTSWLYSKKYGKNFYKTILEKSKTEQELSIIDSQTGCPTNTVNLADYLFKLIQNNHFGIHHFTDKKAMTWYDFAKKILTDNNKLEDIKLVKANNYRTFATRPKNSVLAN